MARIHVLTGSGNILNCIVHWTMPTGTNAVGTTWKAAFVAAGMARPSVLPIGNGGHQISNAENNQLTAGDLIETPFQYIYEVGMNATQRDADLRKTADEAVAVEQTRLTEQLRFYGYSLAT